MLASKEDQPEVANFFRLCQERTADACGVSRSTVQRICRESKTVSLGVEEELGVGSSTDIKFRSPRKRYSRNKPVTDLDDFDSEVTRRAVLRFYDKGEFLTSANILAALRKKPDYRGSKSSVKIILKKLNFKYKRCNDRQVAKF